MPMLIGDVSFFIVGGIKHQMIIEITAYNTTRFSSVALSATFVISRFIIIKKY
jgi:hypothetical protein